MEFDKVIRFKYLLFFALKYSIVQIRSERVIARW